VPPLPTRLLLLLVLLPSSAAALEFVREPYLQSVGATEATVVFRTDVPCDGEVLAGPAPGEVERSVATRRRSTEHAARFVGLNPATIYFYDAQCDGLRISAGILPENRWFKTAPATGDGSPMRAWVVGDSGTGALPQREVRDAARAHWGLAPPDLFLHMGDMAYGSGTDGQFTLFFFDVYRAILHHVPVFATMGNHEGATSQSASQQGPYYQAYTLPTDGRLGGVPSGTEAWYSFDWGAVHFVVLESHQSDRSPEGPMLTWLANDLEATDQDWIVAFWHHPPYTRGSHNSDVERNHIEMRENALPILEAGGVDLTLGGHSHIYERSYLVHGGYETPSTDQAIVDGGDGRPDGDGPYVVEPGIGGGDGGLHVVAGHGGASVRQDGEHPLHFFAEPAYGSVLLDVHRNRLSVRNVRRDGVVTDRVTLLKGPGVDITSPDGGEEILAGGEYAITWASVETAGPAVVEWTCEQQESWMTIAETDLSAGSVQWTVPFVRTWNGRVRLRATDTDTVLDRGDGLFTVGGFASGAEPIPLGAQWRYLASGDDPGEDWFLPGFDDSGWPSGEAKIGFGEGDETTALPPVSVPSTLFRHTFALPAQPETAPLTLTYDDGFALWVNGEFVGSINAEDVAVSAWADTYTQREAAFVADVAAALRTGENTIAVMVKQASEASVDLSFDLSLAANFSLDEELIQCGPAPPQDPDDPPLPDPPGGCDCGSGQSAFLPLLLLMIPWRRRRA